MLSAVQLYNNPLITFKSESFIVLSVIAWTYLLHSYYQRHGICYRYYHNKGKKKVYDRTKYGAFKHWELERCLKEKACPLDKATIANLSFLIGIRHEIEHQKTNKVDEFLSSKLQACALNFNSYICSLFGHKYDMGDELALVIQFSSLNPEQCDSLLQNSHITSNVKNFVAKFENVLSSEYLSDSRYEYKVFFVPITSNREGQADKVIEFIKSDSPLAEGREKTFAVLKETEKKKFLPKEIVDLMKEKGYSKFTINKHTEIWKARGAKNPSLGYGVQVSKTWYWYQNWVKMVEDYCAKHKDELMS